MSAAASLYIPTTWHTSVVQVLTDAGFCVTVRDRKFGGGNPGREYVCIRDEETITLLETSLLPEDPSHTFVLALAKPRHAKTLLAARDELLRHGALDDDDYRDV